MTNTSNSSPPGSRIIAYRRDSGGERQELSTGQQEAEIRARVATSVIVRGNASVAALHRNDRLIWRGGFVR
jgi:hypothetical protein